MMGRQMKKHVARVRWLASFFLAVVLTAVIGRPVLALPSEEQLDYYNEIGVYYYDPTGTNTNCTLNTSGSGITIIGDSLTVGMLDAGGLQELLPDAKIYAQGSKFFGSPNDEAKSPNSEGNPTGISIVKYLLAEGSLGSTVAFLLDTNGGASETQINGLLELLGTNRQIFLMTPLAAFGGDKYDYMEPTRERIKEAAENANVSVIDWAEEAKKNVNKYYDKRGDGIHPNATGYKFFAELVDKAVGGSTSVTAGSNGNYTNYAGDRVLTDKQISMLEENIPIYQQAIQNTGAAAKGLNWQIVAAMHYKETGFARYNPSNGQGVYQLYSLYQTGMRFPAASSITMEEFLRQTELAITHVIIPNAESLGLDLSNENDVKKLFFAYNGMAKVYKDKAIAMGFSQEEANNGEGSPYVMNAFDARRDPFHRDTMDPAWAGAFVADGVYSETAVSLTYGAFTIYAAMGGATFCASGAISSGGLTLEQARTLMNDYIRNVNCSDWGIHCSHGSAYGPKANCVTFTQYFIARFTSAGVVSPTGDGGWVVSNLTGTDVQSSLGTYNHTYDNSAKGFEYGGFVPRPFAVFSTGYGNTPCGNVKCGHTGIVLGINESAGKIYIGQAGYNTRLVGYSDVIEYDLSKYMEGEHYWYAYTDNIVNISAIQEVIGGK